MTFMITEFQVQVLIVAAWAFVVLMLARFLQLTPHSDDFVVKLTPAGKGVVDIFVTFKAKHEDSFAARARAVSGGIGLADIGDATGVPVIVAPMFATPFAPKVHQSRRMVEVSRPTPNARGRIQVEILDSSGAAIARKWCVI